MSAGAARAPLGVLDPAIIERARAINADALEAIDGLLGESAPSPGGSPRDLDATALQGIADLTFALDRERRLIGELYRAIARQRSAMAQGDVWGIEASVRVVCGVLLTLQEAQRYRGDLLQRLVGDPDQPLQELDARFDAALPEPFLVSRRLVRGVAADVAQEAWCTQGLLLATLRERDALLRELLTGSRPILPAAPATAPTGAG